MCLYFNDISQYGVSLNEEIVYWIYRIMIVSGMWGIITAVWILGIGAVLYLPLNLSWILSDGSDYLILYHIVLIFGVIILSGSILLFSMGCYYRIRAYFRQLMK